MKNVTLEFVQKALAEIGLSCELVVCGNPMPYHHKVKLTADNTGPVGFRSVVVPDELIVRSTTQYTHSSFTATKLWDALKKHKLRIDTSGEGSVFYMVKHDTLQQVSPSE